MLRAIALLITARAAFPLFIRHYILFDIFALSIFAH